MTRQDITPVFTIADPSGEISDVAITALAALLLAVADQEPKLFTAPVNANRVLSYEKSASVIGIKEAFGEMDRDQQRKLVESLAKETGIKGSHD